MTSLSGLIVVRNGGTAFEWALRSLSTWVDETVVVDMASDDGTPVLARSLGARVVHHPPVGYADPARPFGVEQTCGEWIIMIDADELVPLALSKALVSVAQSDCADAVRIPRLNYVLGAPSLGGPLAPSRDRHLRFFKRGALRFRTEPHALPIVLPGTRVLDLPVTDGQCLEHFAHRDMSDLLSRADRYTDIQARQDVASGSVVSTPVALRRAARQFAGGYLKHRGYRDGWRGFHTSAFMAYYELVRQAKGKQLASLGDAEQAEARYVRRAEALVHEYGETT